MYTQAQLSYDQQLYQYRITHPQTPADVLLALQSVTSILFQDVNNMIIDYMINEMIIEEIIIQHIIAEEKLAEKRRAEEEEKQILQEVMQMSRMDQVIQDMKNLSGIEIKSVVVAKGALLQLEEQAQTLREAWQSKVEESVVATKQQLLAENKMFKMVDESGHVHDIAADDPKAEEVIRILQGGETPSMVDIRRNVLESFAIANREEANKDKENVEANKDKENKDASDKKRRDPPTLKHTQQTVSVAEQLNGLFKLGNGDVINILRNKLQYKNAPTFKKVSDFVKVDRDKHDVLCDEVAVKMVDVRQRLYDLQNDVSKVMNQRSGPPRFTRGDD